MIMLRDQGCIEMYGPQHRGCCLHQCVHERNTHMNAFCKPKNSVLIDKDALIESHGLFFPEVKGTSFLCRSRGLNFTAGLEEWLLQWYTWLST